MRTLLWVGVHHWATIHVKPSSYLQYIDIYIYINFFLRIIYLHIIYINAWSFIFKIPISIMYVNQE